MQQETNQFPDRDRRGVRKDDLIGRGRHSLHVDSNRDEGLRFQKLASQPMEWTGSSLSNGDRTHHRRRSRDVLLSPFKSVVRRLHRNSLSLSRDSSMDFELNRPLDVPLHNASPAPEPQLRVPEPYALNRGDQQQDDMDDDKDLHEHLSDTLSFKYPLPTDNANNNTSSNNNENNNKNEINKTSDNVPDKEAQGDDEINAVGENNVAKQTRFRQNTNFPVLVVQSLSKYTFKEDISGAELALRSLRNLSLDRGVHEILTSVGAIQATISAMDRFYLKSVTVLLLGLLFIADLSRGSKQNQLHIGQTGGLQLINRILLDTDIRDVYLLERACITLRTICAGSDYNAVLSGVCGSVEAVLKTMRRWKRYAELQERSLDILTTVVRDASENADIALDSGAVSEVLSTIRQYPKHLNVRVAAARTACELARASETAREDMGGAGIIDDLYQGLNTFNNDYEYTICASRCIRYLAFSTVNRTRIARTTLASTLVSKLSTAQNERRVVASILQALANITYDEQAGKSGAVQGQGTATLLSVLDTYRTDQMLCEAVCRVLRNASDGLGATKRLVARHGCISRVARVVRSHLRHPGIQEHGCAIFINLWPTHEMQVRAVSLDQHLVEGARLHATDEHVMRQINGLGRRLEKANPSCGRAALVYLSQSVDRRMYSKPFEESTQRNKPAENIAQSDDTAKRES